MKIKSWGMARVSVQIECTTSLSAGMLVDIFDADLARPADAASGYAADGFVTKSYAQGATATVQMDGVCGGFSGLVIGEPVYLGANGAITQTPPISGSGYLAQQVGVALSETQVRFEFEQDIALNATGLARAFPLQYQNGQAVQMPYACLPAMAREPNGYENRDDENRAWSNATRTLDLSPVNDAFYVWANGVRYAITTPKSIQIPDTEGNHYLYFDDDGQLTHSLSSSPDLIKRFGFTCALYWDAENKQAIPNPFCETHGVSMSPTEHYYLHYTVGTEYGYGLEVTVNASGDGSLDSHCQFAGEAGLIFDECIAHTFQEKGLTDNFRVLYRSGANWRMGAASSFPVLIGANGRAQWNDENGGNWRLLEVGSGDFVLAHIYAMPGLSHTAGTWAVVMGQAVYSTASTARRGAITELAKLKLTGLPSAEFRAIATLLIETRNTFTNTVKSRIVALDTGDSKLDWRRVDPITVSTTAKLLGM